MDSHTLGQLAEDASETTLGAVEVIPAITVEIFVPVGTIVGGACDLPEQKDVELNSGETS
jgi:hypothetical protein